jgi:hypothetical protein
MNTMATALVNAEVVTPKPVKKEKKVMKQQMFSQSQVQELVSNAVMEAMQQLRSQPQAVLPPVPVVRQGTKPEDTWIAKLGGKIHQAGAWGTDKVLVPTEQYTRDRLVPDTLAVTATSTGWVARKLDGISKAAAKKSESLRPAVDTSDPIAVLNTFSKAQLVAALAKLQSK